MGNWNVDIAGELGDYLTDLEEINFTFDGGTTNLNFAEAALLIQGSACIYSKKVEYLHALVFQALDVVADKKRQEDAVANGDTVDDEDRQDEATFLGLDDCLDEADSSAIDLDEGDFFSARSRGGGADADTNYSRVGANAPPKINLAHTALLQMIQGKDCGEGAEYKMSSCAIHPSGAMVLDAADVSSLDASLSFFHGGTGAGAGSIEAAAAWLDEANRIPVTTEQEAGAGGDEDQAALMDDDDNDFGGGGFMDDDGGDFALGAAGGSATPAPAPVQQPHQGDEVEGEDEEEDFDPYAPLDMHDPNGLPLRPFKKGRPGGAKALQKKKDAAAAAVTAACAAGTTDGSSSANNVESMVLSLLAAAAAGVGAAGNKAEFAYALQSLECSRRALRHKAKGGKKTVTAMGDLLGLGASAAAAAAGEEEYDDEGDDDGWAGAGGFDDDGDDAGGYESFEEQNAEGGGGLAGLVGTAAAAAMGEAGELTYEELCQAHVNKFLAAAAAAEVQSELAGRVQTWKSRVDPAIAEQDAREQFDIHVYGDRVIGRLDDNVAVTRAIAASGDDRASGDGEGDATVEMAFGDMVAGQEKWQVARMFASMLQLVNNGNIAVEQRLAVPLPGPSGSRNIAETTSKRGVKKTKQKQRGAGTEVEERGDEMEEDEGDYRPTGAAYSMLDIGELRLRLLTSEIRELDISAARHRPDAVPALPALPAAAAAAAEKDADEEKEENKVGEEEKHEEKRQRGRPKKRR